MPMQLVNHEEVNTDEKCTEGLYVFMFYFELKCFEYCLGDSPVAHVTLPFILVAHKTVEDHGTAMPHVWWKNLKHLISAISGYVYV